MPDSLLELVSRLRYEFLSASGATNHVTGLFRYFNAAYHELSMENRVVLNPAEALKDKSALSTTGNAPINILFEKVYSLLREGTPIDSSASADLMLIYSIGLVAAHELAELSDTNKKEFFQKIIQQYNYEFHSDFTALDNFRLESFGQEPIA